MEKRGRLAFTKILVTLLSFVFIFHLFFHFTVYESFFEKSLSGYAITKLSFAEDFRVKYQNMSIVSRLTLALEIIVLVSLSIFILVRQKLEMKKEHLLVNPRQKYGSKNSTDLDILYNLLKDKKHLKISTISNAFKVKKDTVMDWGRILESGDLAEIHYPRLGEAEIRINEKQEKDGEKKEKAS